MNNPYIQICESTLGSVVTNSILCRDDTILGFIIMITILQ